MCGRYASSRRPEDLVEEFDIPVRGELPRLDPDYNVAPTDPVYAVVARPPSQTQPVAERQLRVLRWGLVPFWSKSPTGGARMINARVETVAEKPAFRRAFEKRRCVIPADGYYEWYLTDRLDRRGKPVKQPFFIRPRDGGVLAMAGLFEIWRDPTRDQDDPERNLWTCTVITTSAEDSLGHIHDRMPMMLAPERRDAWLDPRPQTREELLGLLTPAAPGQLEAYPVSSAVGNVANNSADLIRPLPLEGSDGDC
ncbi:MAG TPA: SOS response-associated peptidase [Marmoricola sp.]|nr:SOS response-associated peptidase [Marmoricola sp.]